VADPNYHFVSWSDGVLTAARTDLNVTADLSITANFAIDTFAVTASAGANGSVTPTTQTVDYDSSASISITPSTGYHVTSITDNLAPVTITDPDMTSYAISNVAEAHEVAVTFAIDTFTVNASVDGGLGTVLPVSQTVDYGSNATTINITPNLGWHIEDVLVDDLSVGVVTSVDFTDVTANHEVAVTFAIDTFTLTYTAGEHGTLTGSTPQTVDYGGSGTAVEAVPDLGYHFVNWSDASTDNPRTDLNITADLSVTANFAGPGSAKQDVLDELIALRATVTDKQDGNKLDEAIKHLEKSLTPAWWTDDAHLQVKDGEKVFNEEKDAVNQLRDLIKDKKSSISDMTLQSFVDRIVAVDRLLAVVAIADATGGDSKDIAKANDELGKGDNETAKGKYDSAIEHYRNAWKFAQKAIK
jgi:hypothetical protein